jgi:hypothetical protein
MSSRQPGTLSNQRSPAKVPRLWPQPCRAVDGVLRRPSHVMRDVALSAIVCSDGLVVFLAVACSCWALGLRLPAPSRTDMIVRSRRSRAKLKHAKPSADVSEALNTASGRCMNSSCLRIRAALLCYCEYKPTHLEPRLG